MKIRSANQQIEVKLTYDQVALMYLLLDNISGKHNFIDSGLQSQFIQILGNGKFISWMGVNCDVYINNRYQLSYNVQVLTDHCQHCVKLLGLTNKSTFAVYGSIRMFSILTFLLCKLQDSRSFTLFNKMCKVLKTGMESSKIGDIFFDIPIKIQSPQSGIEYNEEILDDWIASFTLHPFEIAIRNKEKQIANLQREIRQIELLASKGKTKELEKLFYTN